MKKYTQEEIINFLSADAVPCHCTKCGTYITDAEPDLDGTEYTCDYCKSSGKYIKSVLIILGYMLLMATACQPEPPVVIQCQTDEERLKEQYKDMQVGLKLQQQVNWSKKAHCQRGKPWKETIDGYEESRWVCMSPKDLRNPVFLDIMIAEGGNLVIGIKRVN